MSPNLLDNGGTSSSSLMLQQERNEKSGRRRDHLPKYQFHFNSTYFYVNAKIGENTNIQDFKMTYKVLVSPSGRMSLGCCWMVMGELELEPDAELPEERLGGCTPAKKSRGGSPCMGSLMWRSSAMGESIMPHVRM